MIEYLYLAIYKSFAFLLKTLPESWLDSIIKALAKFAYFASKKRRRVIQANLEICFPKLSKAEQKEIGIHSYQNLLYSIASFIKGDSALAKVTYHDKHYVTDMVKSGKKIILITAHYGVWEVISPAAAKGFEIPFSVVGRELDAKRLQKYLKEGREKEGIQLINKRGALKGMIKALSTGRVLGLLVDQSLSPSKGGEDVTFFGKRVTQTAAASILAHKFDAVIIPVFISSKDFKHHDVRCYPPIMIDKSLSKEEDIKRLNQAQADVIQQVIEENPKEWFWSHKRFKIYNKEIYDV
jgi:KDO2-lipid IV(A) lauroyltransferase